MKATFAAHVLLHVIDGKPIPVATSLVPEVSGRARARATGSVGARVAGKAGAEWRQQVHNGAQLEPAKVAPRKHARLGKAPKSADSTSAAVTAEIGGGAATARPWHAALWLTEDLLQHLYPEFLRQVRAWWLVEG